MNVLDLFSGIGGFSLGLERAGMRTVAFCEIDPFCRRVLAKHWPNVPCYDDVRTLTAGRLRADGISVDVICGGFPCQDISRAGQKVGITGHRSGLWSEYARIIGEVRPRYVIVENVSDLLSRGLADVLGDLAALGFDAEWDCVPAAAVGAPHLRDRLWIVAYADRQGEPTIPVDAKASRELVPDDAGGTRRGWSFADSRCHHAERRAQEPHRRLRISLGERSGWASEPDVGRVAHGVPARVDRLKGLGNAVVPQIPEIIGRAIMTVTTKE